MFYDCNSCHVSACPGAPTLLNPTCCVADPVTDFSRGYFLLLSAVWAFLADWAQLELAVIDCAAVRMAVGGETR